MERTDENEIFEKNIKLAYMVVHRYKNYIKEKEDITQIAMEGLWIAVKNYDQNKGKFSTFAVRVMTNNINYYLRSVKKEANNIHLYDPICGGTEKLTFNDILMENSFSMEEVEERVAIEDCFKRLNLRGKEQEIFSLWLEGKKQTDIAEAVGKSQSSVSRSIEYIKKKLKDNLMVT